MKLMKLWKSKEHSDTNDTKLEMQVRHYHKLFHPAIFTQGLCATQEDYEYVLNAMILLSLFFL